ncbi:MAG: hypothetical protein ACRD3L_10170 [Terriglobales bacterium]
MEAIIETAEDKYAELSRLFYTFRLAHFNRKYYCERLEKLKFWDKAFQITITVSTAASFALLSFADFPHVKTIAAIFAIVAFLFSVASPGLNLNRKIDETSARVWAFHYAAQQLENALRFVKNSGRADGESTGWIQSAEDAYHQAAALPDTDIEDQELLKKVEDEINQSFPSSYVWTAF